MANRRHAPLLIAVRAHRYPAFVADVIDSVFHYATTFPHVIVAIDRGHHKSTGDQDRIAKLLARSYPQVGVYRATCQWGWGAGMYGLLCNSFHWARQNYSFDHFLSLDYDALFIGEGADARLLEDGAKKNTGLVGTITSIGKTWAHGFEAKWPEVMRLTKGREPPPGWENRCVYGAVMLLTKRCIRLMLKAGYFDDPVRDVRRNVGVADDAWLSFLVKTLGFDIRTNASYCYNVWKTPEDYRDVLKQRPDLKIWHPAKMSPGGRPSDVKRERICRNWFRLRRGKKPLPEQP